MLNPYMVYEQFSWNLAYYKNPVSSISKLHTDIGSEYS